MALLTLAEAAQPLFRWSYKTDIWGIWLPLHLEDVS
jgi:hypothetical protein